MPRKEITQELLRYTFSPAERADLSDKLAAACQDRMTAEEEKKSALATFKSRIDKESANVNHLSRLVNNGWEMRPTDCRIEYNTPSIGTKRISRIDTGDFVSDQPMTGPELQDTITFVDPSGEEKLAQKQKEADLEREIRRMLEMEDGGSIEPVDLTGVTSYIAGEFIFAAESEEDALKLAIKIGITIEPVWTDPDATYITGLESLYGDESRTCRAAIIRMSELGHIFPCLLYFPLPPEAKATHEETPSDDKKKADKKKKGDKPEHIN